MPGESRSPRPHTQEMGIPGFFLDETTGLPTRDWSIDQLKSSVAHHPGEFAFVFIDIDGLKAINDERGHKAGDVLLRDAAQAIQSITRHDRKNKDENDQLAVGGRLGGDEFMLILPGVTTKEAWEIVQNRISEQLAGVGVKASMGGCVHKKGESYSELLEAADGLMYKDKTARKQMVEQAEQKLLLQNYRTELKNAPRTMFWLHGLGVWALKRSGIKRP